MIFGDPIHDVLALWVAIIKMKIHFLTWLLFVKVHLFSWGKIHVHYIIHLQNVVGRTKEMLWRWCMASCWMHTVDKPSHNPWTQHTKETKSETTFLFCINITVWTFHLGMHMWIQNQLFSLLTTNTMSAEIYITWQEKKNLDSGENQCGNKALVCFGGKACPLSYEL